MQHCAIKYEASQSVLRRMQRFKPMRSIVGIELFHKVAEHGSFSEVARQTGSTPSSVSRRIDQLEASLHSRLFNRTTRKLHLTEAGARYYERTRNILAELKQANLEISNQQKEPIGTLRLNTSVIFGRRFIAPRLPEFLARYPRVDIEFQMTDKYVDLIEDRVDLAIRMGRPRSSALVARKILPVPRFLVASPAYLKRRGEPQTPSDLIEHNCIQFGRGNGQRFWEISRGGDTSRQRLKGNVVCDNLEAINSIMLNGGGIAHLPIWIVRQHIENGEAAIVLPEYRTQDSGRDANFYAIYPSRSFVPSTVRAFLDFIVRRLQPDRRRFDI
jgi:DNA-binding transcriptional LysR family regulator